MPRGYPAQTTSCFCLVPGALQTEVVCVGGADSSNPGSMHSRRIWSCSESPCVFPQVVPLEPDVVPSLSQVQTWQQGRAHAPRASSQEHIQCVNLCQRTDCCRDDSACLVGPCRLGLGVVPAGIRPSPPLTQLEGAKVGSTAAIRGLARGGTFPP